MTTERNGRVIGAPRGAATTVPDRRPQPQTRLPLRSLAHTPELTPARTLWAAMSPALAQKMRPMAGRLVQEVVHEIQKAVPEYAQPLEGKFRDLLVGGVEMAIVKCFDNICDPHAPQADWNEVFRHAGKVEFLEGRTMDALQTAVRVGARVVWRQLSATGRALGLPNDMLFALADAIFAYIDEICAVAVAGYTSAQANASGALERRRRQLLRLILSEPSAPLESILDLAGATNWNPPERIAAIALEYREDQHRLPATSLGKDILVDLESGEPCLVLADPHRHIDRIAQELHGRRAVVGPTVALTEARRSLASARRAMGLVQRGVLPDNAITWVDQHLTTLLLMSNEFLVTQLASRTLAPFDGLKAKQRERLAATLLAWLETRGGINEIASRLDIHPQTVRYRMHQIEELLGDSLADPDTRLSMEIALRANTLIGKPGRSDDDGTDDSD